MTSPANANIGCLLVGEYVDEGEIPPNTAYHCGEVVRPKAVASYLDLWSKDDGVREFTVLLRDSRVVTVRGHALKYVQNPANPGDYGSYAILARAEAGDITVALFRVTEVTGIFSGNMQHER